MITVLVNKYNYNRNAVFVTKKSGAHFLEMTLHCT